MATLFKTISHKLRIFAILFLLKGEKSAWAQSREVDIVLKAHHWFLKGDCRQTLRIAEPVVDVPRPALRGMYLADGRKMVGICSYRLGLEARAIQYFRLVLQNDPLAKLPKYDAGGPDVLALFEKIREEVLAHSRAGRKKALGADGEVEASQNHVGTQAGDRKGASQNHVGTQAGDHKGASQNQAEIALAKMGSARSKQKEREGASQNQISSLNSGPAEGSQNQKVGVLKDSSASQNQEKSTSTSPQNPSLESAGERKGAETQQLGSPRGENPLPQDMPLRQQGEIPPSTLHSDLPEGAPGESRHEPVPPIPHARPPESSTAYANSSSPAAYAGSFLPLGGGHFVQNRWKQGVISGAFQLVGIAYALYNQRELVRGKEDITSQGKPVSPQDTQTVENWERQVRTLRAVGWVGAGTLWAVSVVDCLLYEKARMTVEPTVSSSAAAGLVVSLKAGL